MNYQKKSWIILNALNLLSLTKLLISLKKLKHPVVTEELFHWLFSDIGNVAIILIWTPLLVTVVAIINTIANNDAKIMTGVFYFAIPSSK